MPVVYCVLRNVTSVECTANKHTLKHEYAHTLYYATVYSNVNCILCNVQYIVLYCMPYCVLCRVLYSILWCFMHIIL